ncbi:hypothetical protein HYV50_04630 [Candidatus Pacearchaeota archaeon]|nr:hypothetical protein [Candidatus Pacearchaeota archaeon]
MNEKMKLIDFNIFNFGNLFKLYNQGKIDKVYKKMYGVAEDLAIHETIKYQDELIATFKKKNIKNLEDYSSRVLTYRKKRLENHMKRMIKLLKLYTMNNNNVKK